MCIFQLSERHQGKDVNAVIGEAFGSALVGAAQRRTPSQPCFPALQSSVLPCHAQGYTRSLLLSSPDVSVPIQRFKNKLYFISLMPLAD